MFDAYVPVFRVRLVFTVYARVSWPSSGVLGVVTVLIIAHIHQLPLFFVNLHMSHRIHPQGQKSHANNSLTRQNHALRGGISGVRTDVYMYKRLLKRTFGRSMSLVTGQNRRRTVFAEAEDDIAHTTLNLGLH